MTDDARTFTYEMRIEASPEVVYSYFTDPERMALWMGIEHKLDPVPGGVFRVDVNGSDVAVGEFVELDPPRRLVFTWGWQGSAEVPPGSTTIEVNLAGDGDATLLRFAHHGLPAGQHDQHAHGWNHFLGRLMIAAAGGDPGPDSFVEAG
ncbi:MAG TPA: SRPBCC domain-containing protein [Acidimicrobiales bacterium]|nr:SRPBCC domain-containing protein [Acidimicrobiales bacterium]